MPTVLAFGRSDAADFVNAVLLVYTLIIIAFILQSLYFGFGGRLPYAQWSSAVLEFLNQTAGPFLAFFRRFIPQFGPLDLSPMVALIVLQFGGGLLVRAIGG